MPPGLRVHPMKGWSNNNTMLRLDLVAMQPQVSRGRVKANCNLTFCFSAARLQDRFGEQIALGCPSFDGRAFQMPRRRKTKRINFGHSIAINRQPLTGSLWGFQALPTSCRNMNLHWLVSLKNCSED